MMPEILKYRFIRDVAAGRAEVASRPEVASPVTFAKLWELTSALGARNGL
jgi:hypothetical protein